MLRGYVQGGGCSGFQYGFEFEEKREEDDLEFERDGVKLLVDSMRFQYLMENFVLGTHNRQADLTL